MELLLYNFVIKYKLKKLNFANGLLKHLNYKSEKPRNQNLLDTV